MVVDTPSLSWQDALRACEPCPDESGCYLCPAWALAGAWDALTDYHVDLLACRRDLRDSVEMCRVRLAAAESAGDDWWLWALAGVAVGAAAIGGLWVGCGR